MWADCKDDTLACERDDFITGINYHKCVSLNITVINEGM